MKPSHVNSVETPTLQTSACGQGFQRFSSSPPLPGARKNRVAIPRLLPDAGRRGRRRSAILGTILFCAFLWAQTASADPLLLRGPRKAVLSNTESLKMADGKIGLMEEIAAAPILFYQRFLRPHWGRSCAYHPSCSNYALQAIRKHGVLVGSVMTFDRLQHEADEAGYAPLILTDRQIKFYDPLENNDYWWHRMDGSAMEEITMPIRNKTTGGIQEEEDDR